ncbi:MAG: hypothetical protein EHM20_02330 [Alphaproteobacteria bacterium]|nr:MAG: hypothetical protein EHM20_02330 [Alphaproteobacteria bacterium]
MENHIQKIQESYIAGSMTDIRVCNAHISKIEDWAGFGLDVNPDGTIYKPGSLYVEAVKS